MRQLGRHVAPAVKGSSKAPHQHPVYNLPEASSQLCIPPCTYLPSRKSSGALMLRQRKKHCMLNAAQSCIQQTDSYACHIRCTRNRKSTIGRSLAGKLPALRELSTNTKQTLPTCLVSAPLEPRSKALFHYPLPPGLLRFFGQYPQGDPVVRPACPKAHDGPLDALHPGLQNRPHVCLHIHAVLCVAAPA